MYVVKPAREANFPSKLAKPASEACEACKAAKQQSPQSLRSLSLKPDWLGNEIYKTGD